MKTNKQKTKILNLSCYEKPENFPMKEDQVKQKITWSLKLCSKDAKSQTHLCLYKGDYSVFQAQVEDMP